MYSFKVYFKKVSFIVLTVSCLVLQDLYVDRLTENVDKLREQISLYEAQFYAQGEETKAAKEALSEARLEIEVSSNQRVE